MRTSETVKTDFEIASALLDAGFAARGFRVLLRAALAGDISAMLGVGNQFYVGIGTRPSTHEALRWYRAAASKEDAAAAHNIGLVYLEQNKRQLARRWFDRSLRLGNRDVLLDLARLEPNSSAGRRRAIARLRALLSSEPDTTLEASRDEATALLARLRAA